MFREISLNEIEMVSGGNRYASSCDADSGYFLSEMSTLSWDDACRQMAKDALEMLQRYYPEINASLDGNRIDVTGWKMPPGYTWAPDPNGEGGISDKYLIAPDGKLVFSPEYAQATCVNAYALQQSRESLASFVTGLNLAMPLTGNLPAGVGVSGLDVYLLLFTATQKLAGELPSYCSVSDGTVDSNYVIQ